MNRSLLLGVVLIIISAVGFSGLMYYLDSEADHPPSIVSWNIESGTRYPHLWANATDSGGDLKEVRLQLYNVSTLSALYNTSCVFGSLSDGYTGNVSADLNCTNTYAGTYYARVVAVDLDGSESDMSEKTIELPDNSPPLPEIVGVPWIWFDSTDSKWHFMVNATDGDGDGLKIGLVIYYVDNSSLAYSATYMNDDSLVSWTAEGSVMLPHGEFMIKAAAWDRAGWQSLSAVAFFSY